MIHFKNRNISQGFTFIEVILAVLMLGIMITAVLGLQNSSFTSIVTYSERLTRLFLLKNMLSDAEFARAENKAYVQQEKKVTETPETTLRYTVQKSPANSALQQFANIFIEKVDAVWSGVTRKNKETIITLLYKPEKDEKEKK